MDVRRRMGIKDESDLSEETVTFDATDSKCKFRINTHSFLREPLKHFVCHEWYGEIHHYLIEDTREGLVYIVSDGTTYWTVYLWKVSCNEANISAHSVGLKNVYRIQSNNPASRNAWTRERKMDWTVNSFARFGFDPYEIIG